MMGKKPIYLDKKAAWVRQIVVIFENEQVTPEELKKFVDEAIDEFEILKASKVPPVLKGENKTRGDIIRDALLERYGKKGEEFDVLKYGNAQESLFADCIGKSDSEKSELIKAFNKKWKKGLVNDG